MWGQKLKSGQAKAELSIAPLSKTTPTVTLSRPLCRSLPGSWISLTAYLLLVCMLEGVTVWRPSVAIFSKPIVYTIWV